MYLLNLLKPGSNSSLFEINLSKIELNKIKKTEISSLNTNFYCYFIFIAKLESFLLARFNFVFVPFKKNKLWGYILNKKRKKNLIKI